MVSLDPSRSGPGDGTSLQSAHDGTEAGVRRRIRSRVEPRGSGFSERLITSALIRLISSERVYITGGRQSMNLKVFLHTRNERAETSALLDCGATENFIHLDYARRRKLPVKTLERPRKVINVDSTPNAKGEIQHYVDLELKQGDLKRTLRFFLTDIGDRDIILGYPWFAAIQPNIDWARGWIATEQLPVILKTMDAGRARFVPRQRNVPRQSPDYAMHMAFVMFPDRTTKSKQTLASQLAEQHHKVEKPILPAEYCRHSHVFSEHESHCFPNPRLWDHAIELKKDAPSTLPGKVYSLTQQEQKTLEEFLVDHLKRGYIRPSKSPYASPFFFIKKKDGKLRPGTGLSKSQ
jgi:hypothetical protein